MNLTILASLLSLAAGFGLAWQLQAGNITTIKLEVANERIAQQRAARATIERTTSAVIVAQNNAVVRARTIAAERNGFAAERDRLREQSALSLRAAASSLEACNRVAAAQGVILSASSGFIQELVGNADQCFSDIKTLIEAWPE